MSYSVLTLHAAERGEDRLNLRPESFIRMTDRALDSGLRPTDFSGKFRRYLDKLFLSKKRATNIRIYGDHIYLFAENTLITVLSVPNEFRNRVTAARRLA